MKNKEHQEKVTAKVQATFKKYPALTSVPPLKKKDEGATAIDVAEPAGEREYLTALYQLFNLEPKADLAGRLGNRLEASE